MLNLKGWNGEEVHRRDGFSVIAKKGQPAFGWLRLLLENPCSSSATRSAETTASQAPTTRFQQVGQTIR